MNRVDCINKADRDNPWERILRLGGVRDDNGQRWSCSQQECVVLVRQGVQFYVLDSLGNRVYLEVEVSRFGNEYVKTRADYQPQDNLLRLPECA